MIMTHWVCQGSHWKQPKHTLSAKSISIYLAIFFPLFRNVLHYISYDIKSLKEQKCKVYQ